MSLQLTEVSGLAIRRRARPGKKSVYTAIYNGLPIVAGTDEEKVLKVAKAFVQSERDKLGALWASRPQEDAP